MSMKFHTVQTENCEASKTSILEFPSQNHDRQTIVVSGVYVVKKGKLEHAASILRRKRKAVFVAVGCVLGRHQGCRPLPRRCT